MKRLVIILFIVGVGVAWRGYDFLKIVSAQKSRTAAPSKFARFTHKSHKGTVKSLIAANKTAELNCAYCHGSVAKDKLGKDQHDLEAIGYPSHKNGAPDALTHSACTECHAITGSAAKLDMCGICHTKTTMMDNREMKTNIRRFPNPDGGGVSQFYDYFAHSSHVDYYDQYATQSALKGQLKFFDAKATDPKANKGLDKNKFECAACHTANAAPVTVAKISFAAGVKMSAPGHPECFVCHSDPKIVSPPKPDKPNPKNTFATNCTGCHADVAKSPKDNRPVSGSETNVHWFARQIVNTELNPPKTGAKSPLPFSHKTHDDAIGKSVSDCLSCHATAKTANTLKDFYLEDRKTKEKQPTALGCVECHKKEMQAKIEGPVTIETAKCNYCHALTTIKAYGAKGIAMPPPSHFGKKAIQPAPAPATAAPTEQPVKPAPTPTPAKTPTPAPVKTPMPQAQTPVVTSTTAQASTTVTAPTSAPPKPSPAPTPVPAQPPVVAAAAKPAPSGIIRLGDPKESPHWGQHDKWGVVENFNHGNHIKPTYSQSCQDCHHTNKDARVEAVLKCISCHKETGHADTESKGGGVEVKDAYHGIAGSSNTKNKAGCIECHKTYRDEKNADTKAPIKECISCHTEKQAWLDPRKLNPARSTQAGESDLALRKWMSDFRASAQR